MRVEFTIKKFRTTCGVSIINFWRFIDKCMGPDLGLDHIYLLSQVINLGSINLDRFYCIMPGDSAALPCHAKSPAFPQGSLPWMPKSRLWMEYSAMSADHRLTCLPCRICQNTQLTTHSLTHKNLTQIFLCICRYFTKHVILWNTFGLFHGVNFICVSF